MVVVDSQFNNFQWTWFAAETKHTQFRLVRENIVLDDIRTGVEELRWGELKAGDEKYEILESVQKIYIKSAKLRRSLNIVFKEI